MTMIMIQPVSTRIAASPPGTEHWLWCDGCHRFLPLERGLQTSPGWWDCPYDDCHDGHLVYWDSLREPLDPRWPQTTAELCEGDRSPEMHEFYKAQFQSRSAELVAEFAAELGQPSRYLGEFLRMMWCCSWDLTERDPGEGGEQGGIDPELAASFMRELPAYAGIADLSQAAPMLEEMRSFFAFAERANVVPYAEAWSKVVADDGLVESMQDTMKHDQRAQRFGPTRSASALSSPPERCIRQAEGKAKRKRQARRKARRAHRRR